ncbi:MAG: 50S ribosome-binding GTPase [Candidatus Aenigmarchaeota archaeon]|nr:50S ribosome-binding GTPase [Candidatus Aenigmarchaeota archaeon]
MPVNAGPEYFAAERRYSEARTLEEKIIALEEMIRTAPKHKSSEHLLADLRKRLSKLKRAAAIERRKSQRPKFTIRKDGAAQICIVGITKSGKSTLLNSLTNADVEIGEYPYTTKEPKVGMMFYNDLQFQLVEIPSTFNRELSGLLHSCDLILVILDSEHNIEKQKNELMKNVKDFRIGNKKRVLVKNKSKVCGLDPDTVCIDAKTGIGLDELKEKMWKELGMIKIYTKSPNKPKAIPAVALKINSTVEDLAKKIHKDLAKEFKFARIFNSTKFSGKKVGLGYKLQDNDIVEVHTE